jgi:hypothetical protein
MFQLIQAASNRKRISETGGQKIHVASLVQSQMDLIFIKELLESGKIMPVIDGCYPLIKTPEAFWYFEKVHPKGKVVIMGLTIYVFSQTDKGDSTEHLSLNQIVIG